LVIPAEELENWADSIDCPLINGPSPHHIISGPVI
jgi:hypothetical protein